ncbi:IS3 family transposase, partial [Aquimarina sp. RZ0]|uniref:IS3 family transposase n=1 Tax=Aquimarina sp. RZ0 TaxID=2607730 RepID=UPI0034CE829F
KYEKIYLNPPNGGLDLYQKVKEYIEFYNTKRRHTEIGKVPPKSNILPKTNGFLEIKNIFKLS